MSDSIWPPVQLFGRILCEVREHSEGGYAVQSDSVNGLQLYAVPSGQCVEHPLRQ